MKIVADENIPYVREAFCTLGGIALVSGRSMNADTVKDADVLLVRSVTKVNEELLGQSRIRFVATATIGTDHIDLEFLESKAIAFAAAPGSNANSVAEYIISALFALAQKYSLRLSGSSIGVVGVGNVGSKVVKKARALDMKVLENDPPLARAAGDERFVPIEKILQCDFITFHVPVTIEGEDATYHIINERLLSSAKKDSFIFNTSRGAVADTTALIEALDRGRIRGSVIDVWENEPAISMELLNRVDLGTSHIAGYSLDGKVNGTNMIYQALCRFLEVEPTWSPAESMPPPPVSRIEVEPESDDEEKSLAKLVHSLYDIRQDDARLREIISLPEEERGRFFDQLRRNYPVRREFHNTVAALNNNHQLARKVAGIGFRPAG